MRFVHFRVHRKCSNLMHLSSPKCVFPNQQNRHRHSKHSTTPQNHGQFTEINFVEDIGNQTRMLQQRDVVTLRWHLFAAGRNSISFSMDLKFMPTLRFVTVERVTLAVTINKVARKTRYALVHSIRILFATTRNL